MEASFRFVDRTKCCEDITRYMKDVIANNGYQFQEVELCTEDGYYIKLYRIQNACNRHDGRKKEPVLIVHGLTQSMAEFVMEKQQLGYFLTDSGYDVWVANCRGTTFSRKHRSYTENSKDYWNYSFHEIGYYDAPKFIDYILKETKYNQLHYIGVSQGCAVLSVLLSTRTEYNKKIKVACFLCPAIKFRHIKMSLMKIFFLYICPFFKWTNEYLHLPIQGDILSYWLRLIGLQSSKYRLSNYLYQLSWAYFGGYVAGNSNISMDLGKLCRTSPNTVSLKQTTHYSQLFTENTFRMFDYGPDKNLEKYKRRTPPNYDFSKITAPIGLFYSRNDTCYGLQDMEDLSKELGNCVHQFIVEDELFSHFDFVYHKNVKDLLHVHILDFIKKYSLDSSLAK